MEDWRDVPALFWGLLVLLWHSLLLSGIGACMALLPMPQPRRLVRGLRAMGWLALAGLPAALFALHGGTTLDAESGSPAAMLQSVSGFLFTFPFLWILLLGGDLLWSMSESMGLGGLLLVVSLFVALPLFVYWSWSSREAPWRNPGALVAWTFVLLNSLAGAPELLAWMVDD